MATPPDAAAVARRGADSVFGYLRRTAEAVPDGLRWRTLTYENTPAYDPGFWDGGAGIAVFLADYARLTGSAPAREMAAAALAWCTAHASATVDEPEGRAVSLGWGWAGIGTAWLRLATATRHPGAVAGTVALGERVLAAGAGQRLSLLQGAAGQGTFLLRLWQATGEQRFLDGAVVRALALRERLLPGEFGGAWPPPPGAPLPPLPTGIAPGLAGIGYFLAVLHEGTGDARWAAVAAEVAGALAATAVPDRGGLSWPLALNGATPRTVDLARSEVPRCQWCLGAPGIGLFYLALARASGDAASRATAEAAGNTAWAYGDARGNPGYCHGLAGTAELFLELARLTGERRWRARAGEFAARMLAYRTTGPAGDVWPADEPGLEAPNFSTGAAGVGHVFLRLLAPGEIPLAWG